MPVSTLLQMVREEDFDGFESFCLDALEKEQLKLGDLVAPFEELERHAHADHAATLGQMVLENVDAQSDPSAALRIARIALLGEPKNDGLRGRVIELYRQVHGDKPGFEALLEMSGLTSGRPARNSLRMIDICLTIAPGDALISRTEDAVVEVINVDLAHGLITLRHPRRPLTITPIELSREYERVAADDFRVLRALKPDQLVEMLHSDPVAVIIGLIHAHGDMISQDVLKSELVPKYIQAKEWSKWWTRAKAKCQRSTHVIIEGRAPVMLSYTSEAWTLEDEIWKAFEKHNSPGHWLATIEAYLREKKKHKEPLDPGLLVRCHDHLNRHRETIQKMRPSDALACALVSTRIAEVIDDVADEARDIVLQIFRETKNPARLIRGLEDESLWARALEVLADARPEDAATSAAELIPRAQAALLDRLVALCRRGEALELAQAHIDTALADPVDYPEIIYWLWKGPKQAEGLRLPTDDDLFAGIVQTLSALGRTLNPSPDVTKAFRHRIRTVLALRDYARADACIERIAADRAITLRTQLERLEGVGDNFKAHLLSTLRDRHPELWIVKQRRVEPWEDANVLWNSAKGIKRKTEERDHLVNVTMHENAKRIGEAASHGDLSENSEYKFALEERDFLRARLAQMNNELTIAQAIDTHMVPTEHVGVGSRVTLRDAADGATRVMTFLGPFDTDVERGVYNYRAPVSQALMGLRIGDRKTLSLDNRDCELEVVDIANGLSEA